MITPLISLAINDEGNILNIKDITTYGDPLRSNVALLIAWSNDAFATDFNYDYGNPDPGEWNEMIANGHTYNVMMFACYIFSPGLDVDFAQKAIIYDNGNFYLRITDSIVNYSVSGGLVSARPSLDPSNWVLFAVGTVFTFEGGVEQTITIPDIYSLIGDSLTAEQPIGKAENIIDINVASAILEKMTCHNWRLRNNSTKTITFTNFLKYDRTLLKNFSTGDTIDINFEEFGDGMYILQVGFDNGNQTETMVEYPIPDFCDAYECFINLFKYSLCVCGDPCSPSEDCNDKIKTKLDDMNAIRELITCVKDMVQLQASQQMGLYGQIDSPEDFIVQIGTMLDKLKIVTDRCGLCGEETLGKLEC